ncbi:MAG TPA: hypothetical protein DER58_06480 [Firmicutes bacterium]|nr:hypothetical protein [Bacillota bacterium]
MDKWLVMIYAGACNDLQSGFQSFLDRNAGAAKLDSPHAAAPPLIKEPPHINAPSHINAPPLTTPHTAVLLQVTLSQPELAGRAQPEQAVRELPPLMPSLAQTLRCATAPTTGALSLVRGWNPYPFPLPAHNPHHLYDFLKWGLSLTEYRRARPILILSGHSAGLLGVLEDRSQGYPMLMTIPAMSRALRAAQAATQRHIELLVLDMCFMNSVEILYELAGPEKPAAKYLILPHDDAPLAGMPLEGLIAAIAAISANSALPPAGAGPAGQQTKPAVQAGQTCLTRQAVQAIVNYVNHHWISEHAACYGIRLDNSRMEAMATTLNAIAERYLATAHSKARLSDPLPYREIMQCVHDGLAPQLISTPEMSAPATVPAYAPALAPSLRINLAEDLSQRRIPGAIYGALRFSRLPAWKRLITISSVRDSNGKNRVFTALAGTANVNYATKLFPEMVPVPREILIENLLERFPAWKRAQAEYRLMELGWDQAPPIGYSLESRLGVAPRS